jgi:hypothetical protein
MKAQPFPEKDEDARSYESEQHDHRERGSTMRGNDLPLDYHLVVAVSKFSHGCSPEQHSDVELLPRSVCSA